MTPLTDKQLEAAASSLCESRGVNPKASGGYIHDKFDGLRPCTMLEQVMAELRKYDAITIALSVGRGTEP